MTTLSLFISYDPMQDLKNLLEMEVAPSPKLLTLLATLTLFSLLSLASLITLLPPLPLGGYPLDCYDQ